MIATDDILLGRPGPLRLFATLSFACAAPAAACEVAERAEAVQLAPPSQAAVSQPFGPVRHPILNKVRLHAGWDYDAPLGTPVRAAAPGRVIEARWAGNYGRRVVIVHGGGLETAYAHLSRIAVPLGACVSRGMRVGQVGSTGLSARPHLHFEVRRDGESVDPASWLDTQAR